MLSMIDVQTSQKNLKVGPISFPLLFFVNRLHI